MEGKRLIKHQQKALSFKKQYFNLSFRHSAGHFCASVYNQFYKYLQSFALFLSYSVLVQKYSVPHPLQDCKKTSDHRLEMASKLLKDFLSSNNLIFKNLLTLFRSFCV